MKNKLIAIVWLPLALLLGGCFNATPSEQLMQQKIDARIQQETQGLFKVVALKKLNAYQPDDNTYLAKLKLTLEATQSIDDMIEAVKNDPTLPPLQKMQSGLTLTAMKLAMPNVKAGDRVESTKVYRFIKTENGWRLDKAVEDTSL
ncbi:hypothetical protein SAMN05443662_0108 [Sulfurivirga caldicuralii]|uniref:DUF4878 domain-containing protein n=1 Tax=Sulfurivirga caldicuralii TaxID=364032 RepID=A0A1N6DFS3_9GAMM|nr:hypothetical protein [Sulfurivirga caldicuralii]SIN69606.1 hypothetical protein SAMN05443662_0108 [Sulfurivirga caldicuralii]